MIATPRAVAKKLGKDNFLTANSFAPFLSSWQRFRRHSCINARTHWSPNNPQTLTMAGESYQLLPLGPGSGEHRPTSTKASQKKHTLETPGTP